jgi:hypothetical protein
MADGCAHHLVSSLGWHLERALQEDVTWGLGTVRQRLVTRLRRFQGEPGWPGLHELADAMLQTLSPRWGEIELASFPAFCS